MSIEIIVPIPHNLSAIVRNNDLSPLIAYGLINQETEPYTEIVLEDTRKLSKLIWEEKDRTSSLPAQFDDPLRRALLGNQILTHETDTSSERDISILEGLHATLLKITNPNDASDFINWVDQELRTENKEQCLYFIQSFMQFCLLLDIRSYAGLAEADEGKIPLLPLHTLAVCAQKTSDTSSNLTFQQTYNLFNAQYPISNTTNLELNVKQINEILPDASTLGTALFPWVDSQVQVGQRSLENALLGALKYLHIYEAQNIQNFIDTVELRYGQHDSAVQAVRRRAIEYHLVQTTPTEYLQVQLHGVSEIVEKETKDASEIDLLPNLDEDPDVLKFYILTGSEAPIHVGHLHTHEVILELMREKGELEKDAKVRGVLINAPIVSPHKLEHTKASEKTAAQLGSIETRVEAIIAATRNLEHVYLTTQLQPPYTENPAHRITTIQERLRKKMSADHPTIDQIEFLRIFGAEKIVSSETSLVHEPEEQYFRAAVMVGRRGLLATIIKNISTIRDKYPQLTLVLTPGMPNSSSTQAIREGNFDIMSSVELFAVDGYWSHDQIKERARTPVREPRVPSVTEIDKNLRMKLGKSYIAS